MNKIERIAKSVLSSTRGTISSKRLMGIWMVMVVSGCLIYGIAREGFTLHISEIMDTYMITGAGLLGVDSITRIWSERTTETMNEDSTKDEN